jgi:hypothetical protein
VDTADSGQNGPRPPGERKRFVLRRDHGERAEEINSLYASYTNFARSRAAYEWEWRGSPVGPGLIWVIVEEQSDRLVGHHGIVRVPLVRRGETISGGRTENTVVDPAVRTKLFYPGMEKKALSDAIQTCRVLYTVFAWGAHARVRARLGYKPIGRWRAYLIGAGTRYWESALRKVLRHQSWRLPKPVSRALTLLLAASWRLRLRSLEDELVLRELASAEELGPAYDAFWRQACRNYPMTIDRSSRFLRWRFFDNPNLKHRVWLVERASEIWGLVIAHRRDLGGAAVLEIDDLVVGEYSEAGFSQGLALLDELDPSVDAVLMHTLDTETPLLRALNRRFPVQSIVLKKIAPRMWHEFMAFDRDDGILDEAWYVTLAFTSGYGGLSV